MPDDLDPATRAMLNEAQNESRQALLAALAPPPDPGSPDPAAAPALEPSSTPPAATPPAATPPPASQPPVPTPAAGDDYDEEDHMDELPPARAAAPPTPPSTPAPETKVEGTAPPSPEPEAWDEDKVRAQYKTDEDRVKALAENKTHISKLTAELKALKSQPPPPATEPAPPEAEPEPAAPPEPEPIQIRNAVLEIAREDPQVGRALNVLQGLRTSVIEDDKAIVAFNQQITDANFKVTRLSYTLATLEERRKAAPEDVVIQDLIRDTRDEIRTARDSIEDIKGQRDPIIDRRNSNASIHAQSSQILLDLGTDRVNRAREHTLDVQRDSKVRAETIDTWKTVFPRVAAHFHLPQEHHSHESQVSKDLAREAMAEIAANDQEIPNLEAWLMEHMPPRVKFLENIRGKAFVDYAEIKRQDASLQPAPPVEKARAAPRPESEEIGDARTEAARARAILAQEIRGVRAGR